MTTIGSDGRHVLQSELAALMDSYEVERLAACEKKSDYIPTPEDIEREKEAIRRENIEAMREPEPPEPEDDDED